MLIGPAKLRPAENDSDEEVFQLTLQDFKKSEGASHANIGLPNQFLVYRSLIMGPMNKVLFFIFLLTPRPQKGPNLAL